MGKTTIIRAMLARFVIASVSAAGLFLSTNAAHAAQDDDGHEPRDGRGRRAQHGAAVLFGFPPETLLKIGARAR